MGKTVIKIVPEAGDSADIIKLLGAIGMPEGYEEIQRGRNLVAALTMPDDTRINIKAFGLPNIVNRYVYGVFRKSKARRSYENSQRLREMGFHVPAPLGYVEKRGLLTGFGRSYYVSAQEEGLTEMRRPEQWEFKDALLRALGREMARLHEAGVWMKDFSPGNILFRRRGEEDFTFYYVDLNRLEFTTADDRRLDRMWERLLFSSSQIATATRAYAEARGLAAEEVLSRAMKAHGKYLRSRGMKDID